MQAIDGDLASFYHHDDGDTAATPLWFQADLGQPMVRVMMRLLVKDFDKLLSTLLLLSTGFTPENCLLRGNSKGDAWKEALGVYGLT